jgi:regulator of sigma E protease
MDGLVMAGQLILALAILVTFHEWGHFAAARMFGIKVEKFYLFFDAWGKKLFSFKKGDTEYGIGWLPLGGYVKISGMIDESLDTEQLNRDPEPWEFRSKPAWQRFIVMIGGIVVNLILGYLIMVFYLGGFEKSYVSIDTANQDGIYATTLGADMGFKTGDKLISLDGNSFERFQDYTPQFGGAMLVNRNGVDTTIQVPENYFKIVKNTKMHAFAKRSQVYIKKFPKEKEGKPNASGTGLKIGDRLLKIDGHEIFAFAHMQELFHEHKGEDIEVTYLRDGVEGTIQTKLDTSGKLGIRPEVLSYEDSRTKYTIGSSLSYGWQEAYAVLHDNIKAFGMMFNGKLKAQESVQSIVGIAVIYGPNWDWGRFWRLTAMISIILGFMNALPIPALDGGHMVFLMYEMVTGKPAPDKVLLVAQYIGITLLLLLMVLTVGNDIWKIITGAF